MSYVRTPEVRLRQSLAMKGKNLGRKASEETRKKLSKARKGKRPFVANEETRKKMSLSHIGKKQSPETIEKRRLKLIGKKRTPEQKAKQSGSNSSAWKGGITPVHRKIRNSIEYAEWRKKIFERDDYTCVLCLSRGGIIHADHIKEFSEYPDLRFDINNGRTLCKECHLKTPNYGRRK